MNNFVGSEYIIDIRSIKFDTTISTFNRVQSLLEYNKTLKSIKDMGQIDPIYMVCGYCIDGRHRYKALKELGATNIKALDVNPKLSMEDKLSLCNRDLTSGRDLNKSQLAIQAFKYRELTKVFKGVAAEKFGVGIKQLSFAGEVERYLPDAYESIVSTGKAKVDGKYTSSLQVIYRYINSNIKKGENSMKDKSNSTLDYDKLIDTEQGKELFWKLYDENVRPNAVLAEHLIRYVNLRFVKILN